MRRVAFVVGAVALAAGIGVTLYVRGDGSAAAGPGGAGGGRGGGLAGAGGFRPTITVDVTNTRRARVADRVTVVGSLIGAVSVDVVPKVSGRLESVQVRLGDRVGRGQLLAKLEDREIQEQVHQAEASFDVSKASLRQREADLKFAQTALQRSQNLAARDLVSRQTLDDAQARVEAAQAQVDLSSAQLGQSKARLEELQINLANTRVLSPVDGFVGSRRVDPGAFVGPNSPVVSVVDISLVRLIANLVERDLKRVGTGMAAEVQVDAYPGEVFQGRVARIAPVLDPATRTAQMEVEVPNPAARLKPGMYARVRFTVAESPNALIVPRNAIIDLEGERGVFLAGEKTAAWRPVTTGIQEEDLVEVLSGLEDGDRVVTLGSASLQDGDPIAVAAGRGAGRGAPGGGSRARGDGPAGGRQGTSKGRSGG
ncbi:MAG: efflux RND transporter periplasmic adaptor subunit [Acidobacteriota bacterium]